MLNWSLLLISLSRMMERNSSTSFQQLFRAGTFKAKNAYTGSVIDKIGRCHTAALGYHCYQCDNSECMHTHTQYHSCGNRHCPFCGTEKKDQWVEDRIADLLPCPYYHIVFTVPHAFNKVMMQSPREMYHILFAAASKTLLILGEDNQYLGAAPGITAVLHTWGQKLDYHVHLHCIVSGGGINGQRHWVPPKRANGKFLFPEAALKKVYKAIFLRMVREQKEQICCADDQIDEAIRLSGLRRWKVYAKAPFGGPDQVIKYLGRYTHKTAITHHRIKSCGQGRVRFEYKDYADGDRVKEMELTSQEFMEHFERHILPRRFVRIRHYGLLTNRNKVSRINALREQLNLEPITVRVEVPVAIRLLEKFGRDITCCSKCGKGRYHLLFTKRFGKITYQSPKEPP